MTSRTADRAAGRAAARPANRTTDPRPGQPSGFGWWQRNSLQVRLTAGVVLLLVLACAVIGLVTAFALNSFLMGQVDRQLDLAGQRYTRALEQIEHSGPAVKDEGLVQQGPDTMSVLVVNGRLTQGEIIGKEGAVGPLPLGGNDSAILIGLVAGAGPATVQLTGIGEYRVIARVEPDGDIEITGLPVEPAEQTVGRLLFVEAAVFFGVVVFGGAAAAMVVRLNLRPLNRVTSAAVQVTDLSLSSGSARFPNRLPPAPPGTEIGRLTGAFDHMLGHVERSLDARGQTEARLRQFIADASHELRTPLSVISSQVEDVLHESDLAAPVRSALSRVDAHARRMGLLIDDLLLLARIDAGLPQVAERVDLSRLAIEAVSDVLLSCADHEWRLDLPEEPVEAIADDRAVHQVLANLLANAGRHTPPGTRVTVAVRQDAATAVVEVVDDGPGIPADMQEAMFERFTRVDASRTVSRGGSGLGLSIVQGLVRANGGTVGLSSRPGRTAFHVELPGAPEPAP